MDANGRPHLRATVDFRARMWDQSRSIYKVLVGGHPWALAAGCSCVQPLSKGTWCPGIGLVSRSVQPLVCAIYGLAHNPVVWMAAEYVRQAAIHRLKISERFIGSHGGALMEDCILCVARQRVSHAQDAWV
jgi:hypothetical protein